MTDATCRVVMLYYTKTPKQIFSLLKININWN